MKKKVLFFGWILGLNLQLLAQALQHPIPENFYVIKNKMDAHFDSIRAIIGDSALNADESNYGQYEAWVNRIEPLVYPSGDLMIPYRAEFNNAQARLVAPPNTNSISASWMEIGPTDQPQELSGGGGVGVIHFITIDPLNPNNLVVGSGGGGLFYSTDGGNDWFNANTDQLPKTSASCCAIDPQNSDNWFLGTGDVATIPNGRDDIGYNSSFGIYRKMGSGFNWQLIATAADLGAEDNITQQIFYGWHIRKLLIDPTNDNIVYAATSFGIYKTTNGLDPQPNWQQLPTGGPWNNDAFDDIEFMPYQSSTIYACRDYNSYDPNLPNANIIVSNDGGTTWSAYDNGIDLNGVQRITIETSLANPKMLYALTATASSSGFQSKFYTINTASQNSWQFVNTVPGGAYGNGCNFSHVKSLCISPIAVNPNEEVLFGDYSPIFQSTDGGNTWSNFSSSQPHPDIHDIEFTPDGLTLWATCDGGVWKSTDNGQTWEVKNKGLGVETIYHMAWSESNPVYSLQGNQDCGTNLFDGSTWSHVLYGDGLMPMIDYDNPQTMYASSQGGNISRSDNTGASFPNLAWDIYGSGFEWHTFETMNTNNPSVFYQAGAEVYRTTNMGNPSSWDPISQFQFLFSGSTIYSIYTAPSNPNYLYAFLINPQELFMTNDANNILPTSIIWNPISLPCNNWVNGIAVDAVDPNIFYLVFGGYNDPSNNFVDKKIWKYDGNIQTWTNMCVGLGDYNVTSIVKDKSSDGGIYISTDFFGVFYTNNYYLTNYPNNPWQSFSDGIPNVKISELGINYTSHKIRAATFGRGLWESDLACPIDWDLTITGNLTTDHVYEAEHNIYSDATINSTNNITYRAGNEIILNPGFLATGTPGSDFRAYIQPCDIPISNQRLAQPSSNSNSENQNIKIPDNSFFKVYPNPNSGSFSILFAKDFASSGDIELSVLEPRGRTVYSKTINDDEAKDHPITISGLSSGIYFVSVKSRTDQKYQKIVVTN
ncbi:MAG: T9SS type A sorting domain-containing protein [Bacteroidetes bacterium]|nr:T9SS type A sorting domain-containing protein [Bacteroidota bacterium]